MSLLDLFFPKTCLECGNMSRYVCHKCISKVLPAQPICPYCKHPSIDGATHVNCAKKFGIDGLVSIWKYEAVVRKAILSLKYHYATLIGEEISEHIISSLEAKTLPPVQYLIPVPIHWYKQNTRGFNQSIEIGKNIAKSKNWSFIPDLLIKTKATLSQAGLARRERLQNLQGTFSINPIYKSLLVNLKSVIVFDDVFTTGATIFEAAKVLKRGGVEKVWGLTIAR